MVDDEVPLVLVVAKSGRSTAGLRAWVGLAAIDAAVRVADLVDSSPLLRPNVSARAGIEVNRCLMRRHSTGIDVALGVGIIAGG